MKINNITFKSKPSVDSLKDYLKRVDFLKQVGNFKQSCKEISINNFESVKLQNPGAILSKKDMKPKQIYHRTQLNQEKVLRDSLLGINSSKEDEFFVA